MSVVEIAFGLAMLIAIIFVLLDWWSKRHDKKDDGYYQ